MTRATSLLALALIGLLVMPLVLLLRPVDPGAAPAAMH